MKRWIFAVLALAAAVQAPAQPKVAVLDAVIPESMDEAVIIPVTDKIVEELVVSGKYTVLDRANIEQVLQEKEFQVSGLVKDTEIAKAGEYLGAAFVVIARVSRIEDTYFISARMIDVATGAIMAQTSDQEEGKISVLIAVAGRVGRKLAGGLIEEVTTPQPEEPPRERVVQGGAEAGPPVLSPPAVQMQAPEKPEGFSRFVVSFLYPLFEGDAAEGFDDLVDYYAGANCDTRGYGLDLHWMHFLRAISISACRPPGPASTARTIWPRRTSSRFSISRLPPASLFPWESGSRDSSASWRGWPTSSWGISGPKRGARTGLFASAPNSGPTSGSPAASW